MDDRRVAAAVMRAPRWIPPIPDQFKINFDGAVFSELDAAGLGLVIHDFRGRVIGAWLSVFQFQLLLLLLKL